MAGRMRGDAGCGGPCERLRLRTVCVARAESVRRVGVARALLGSERKGRTRRSRRRGPAVAAARVGGVTEVELLGS